jgi:hypothetical protein
VISPNRPARKFVEGALDLVNRVHHERVISAR